MTVEKFWDKYTNNDILEIFEDACELFSTELPGYFIEEYDVEEILLEVRGHQETEKNFDKVLKFTDIIKDKQPELYQNIFQYFDDFLIDYYCLKQDAEQVKNTFGNFSKNLLQDFNAYLTQLNKVLFYQYTEILQQSVNEESYRLVQNSDEVMDGAEFDLAFIKMYTLLQNVYESKGKAPDIASFISTMEDYDFEFKSDFASSLETGLLKPILNADSMNDLLKKDKEKAFAVIRSSFLSYLHSKDIQFYVSAKITDRVLSYWYEKNKKAKTTNAFFSVETHSFDKFINSFSGSMFSLNESESIAIMWGCVHFYEFLYKHNYISQETFENFLESSRVIKGRIIARYMTDLWKSDFVHIWPKPDCISEVEFIQERNIFKKSIGLKYKPFGKLRNEISDELAEIGELAYHIDEGSNNQSQPNMSLLDSIFNDYSQEFQYINEYPDTPYVREEKKVGRNKPCTYRSGKKYKKCCG
jgi:hypothetical protein